MGSFIHISLQCETSPAKFFYAHFLPPIPDDFILEMGILRSVKSYLFLHSSSANVESPKDNQKPAQETLNAEDREKMWEILCATRVLELRIRKHHKKEFTSRKLHLCMLFNY